MNVVSQGYITVYNYSYEEAPITTHIACAPPILTSLINDSLVAFTVSNVTSGDPWLYSADTFAHMMPVNLCFDISISAVYFWITESCEKADSG